MALIQIQAKLPYTTGLPRDLTVNTFNFVGAGDVVAAAAALIPIVRDFYITAPGADKTLGSYMASAINRAPSACGLVAYQVDLPTGELGDPIGGAVFTMTGQELGTSDLPLEVAVCSSYAASGGVGIASSRRRGRVYFGPINTAVLSTATELPTVDSTFRSRLADASNTVLEDSTTEGWPWAVWSRADAAAHPIVRGWIDNEFDTQRRRGVSATSRTSWS